MTRHMALKSEYHGEIRITFPTDMTSEEAKIYAVQEISQWSKENPGKRIATIALDFDSQNDVEVLILTAERSPIRRVRRITGYLSTVDSFNDAKREEAQNRRPHLP